MKKFLITLLILLIIAMLCIPFVAIYRSKKTIDCKVTDKERITDTNSSKYLIFCENEVIENTDSLLFFKFDSSSIYGQIEKNQEYKLQVYGWRVPFLSMYRNIINIKL